MNSKFKKWLKATAKFISILALLALIAGSFHSYSLANRETHRSLQSGVLNETRTYSVIVPTSYANEPNRRYPVLYVLDGEKTRNNRIAAGIADILGLFSDVPDMIVVSVHGNKKRARDFMRNGAVSAYDGKISKGGAEKFTRYLNHELIPKIDDFYRSNNFRILSGHSRGGLYVMDRFAASETSFNAFFAYSPALLLDKHLLDRLKARVNSPHESEPFLYMNIGYESELYTEYFDRAAKMLEAGNEAGTAKWFAEHHTGILHPLIMMTGEVHALSALY
ncbi:MAG: hypothetical protein JKY60_04500 [Kordiimonadaceae bacterium]|nr:hypothetical protein [Kordiimonadaceae bacterium]